MGELTVQPRLHSWWRRFTAPSSKTSPPISAFGLTFWRFTSGCRSPWQDLKDTERQNSNDGLSQCPSTAVEHITRRTRPPIITRADDFRSPIDARRRQLIFHTTSMTAANVVVGAVPTTVAWYRTDWQQQQNCENYPTKTKRREQAQRSQITVFDVQQTDVRLFGITSTSSPTFSAVRWTMITGQGFSSWHIRSQSQSR